MKDFPEKDRFEFFSSKLDWPWNRDFPSQADLEAMEKPNWPIQEPEKPKPIAQKMPEKVSKVESKVPANLELSETISSPVIEFSAPKEEKVNEAPKDFEDPPKEYFTNKIEEKSNQSKENSEIITKSQENLSKTEQINYSESDNIEKINSSSTVHFQQIESKIEEDCEKFLCKESDFFFFFSKNREKQQQLFEPRQIFQSKAIILPMTLIEFESLAKSTKKKLDNHWLGVKILQTNFSFSIMLTDANFVQIRIADLENKINLSKMHHVATFQTDISRKTLTIRQLVSAANSEWENFIFKIKSGDWIHIAASDFVKVRFFWTTF